MDGSGHGLLSFYSNSRNSKHNETGHGNARGGETLNIRENHIVKTEQTL
jgi:hypothetical protein